MTLKVLALGDIHLRGDGAGTPEADALAKVIELIQARSVDLVLVNGDVFDKDSTPDQRLVFNHFIRSCLEVANVSIIRGNHDVQNDLAIWHEMEGATGLCVVAERASGTHCVINSLRNPQPIHLYRLPHCNPAQIASQSGTLAEAGEAGQSAIEALLANWADRIQEHSGPSLVQFHGTVQGAMLDNGYIPRHNGVRVSQAALDALGIPVLCGHYHRYQQVGHQAWYTGSLTRQNYGESEGDKGVLLLEWEGNNWGEPEFISLNPTRMVLVEARCVLSPVTNDSLWTLIDINKKMEPNLFEAIEPGALEGAQVRFRYTIKADDLPRVDLQPIRDLFSQASELKIERIVLSQGVARSPEISNTQSVEDGLKVWLESGGHSPETYLKEYRNVIDKDLA